MKTICVLLILMAICLTPCSSLLAGESALGNYLPGFQDTLAGVMPPPGTYLKQYFYFYDGSVSKVIRQGRVETNVNLRLPTLISVVNYVTKQKIGSGDYGMALILPFSKARFFGDATNSSGASIHFDRSVISVGDIAFAPFMVGWHKGNSHHIAQFVFYTPSGNYSLNRFVNTGLNRWAYEFDYAYTYLNMATGWEVSIAPGYTIPANNADTDYLSGQELHIDYAAVKRWKSSFGAGIAGFYFQQTTGDSGSGARLGSFKGRACAIGPLVTYTPKLGSTDVTFTTKYLMEFATKNRFNGNSAWLTASLRF